MSVALLIALALLQHEHHQMPPPPAPAAPAQQAAPVDPHAGHQMPAADPHAGHAMPAPAAPAVAVAVPADHAADRLFSPASMAAARATLAGEHGSGAYWMVLAEQAELRTGKGPDAAAFEGEAWIGNDAGRWVLKARGEHVRGEGWESGELQALRSWPIDPYFDLQAGLRQDLEPKGRTYATLGVEGLAPYWIETKAAAFLSERGTLSARLEAAHDLRLTGRLVLQTKIETHLASDGQEAELGLRLRYAITPEFAPYVGLLRHRSFGDEADHARMAGERVGGSSLVVGVRAWF
jgi:copper resistance protein B